MFPLYRPLMTSFYPLVKSLWDQLSTLEITILLTWSGQYFIMFCFVLYFGYFLIITCLMAMDDR